MLTGLVLSTQAQDSSYKLSLEISENGRLLQHMEHTFPDSLAIYDHTKRLIDSLQWQGYLNVEDSLVFLTERKAHLLLETGPEFYWLYLEKGNLEPWMLGSAAFSRIHFQERPFRFGEVRRLIEEVLETGQNQGYPFIAVNLDSLRVGEKQVGARIKVNKGPWIAFDTLQITGSSRTQPLYLARKLKVLPGEPFSQKKLDQAVSRLGNIPYVRLDGSPELSFQNEEATVYLPVNDRKINTLDGIIGLLPNEVEANKWLVTGQFDVQLYNVSGKGRDYLLNWQRLSQYSQNLTIEAREPFVLGSQLDLGLAFSFLKEDTTFLNREFNVTIGLQLSPKVDLSFFGKREAGDLLDVSRYEEANELPDIADFRYNNYGANLRFNDVDDVLMPKNGWRGSFMAGIGNKKLVENTGLPQALYAEAEKNTIQYYLQGNVERYIRWRRKLSTKLALNGGEMHNSNLFLNDLFRLGGLQSIRGFNENYFYASRYLYFTVEPRYYISDESYFLLFSDLGRLENKVTRRPAEWPMAFGGGLSLETNGGIFTFVYALGQASDQPIGFSYSRIHFGFTGRF
ncbi:BamA/TamA family outer membrane protein [Cyclobacterium salsum]|uniref:BamA/TamA family outer membrane protein n=1 Tax=Cyclobacterium salsum TaxID=2666329 RepID=UPI001F2837D5|nr:BamA/TamA family outer membrane protein [Cyclobacterium salsum]